MRAAVLTAPRSVRVETVHIPVPAAGEVRIRLEGCGVCASNVPTWTGMPWTKYPTEPGGLGHEGWGIINAQNLEAEQKAAGVRLRAERRAGELLKESAKVGTRQRRGGDRRSKSDHPILKSPALSELNISLDQSSNW